jgi:hypothetical protein
MAAIPVVTVTYAGYIASTAPTSSTSNQTDTFVNDGKTYLSLHNTSLLTTQTATIVSSVTKAGLAVADIAVTLLPEEKWEYGPFDRTVYGGTVSITWGASSGDINAVALRYAN